MRLIDADAFERNMQNEWENNEISNGWWIHFREMLNQEQTIDAVEVVRCKNCKHASMTIGGQCKYCSFWSEMFDADEQLYLDGTDFCSNGKRKENE